MKQAVDTVYKLLWMKQNDPEKYEATLKVGNRYTLSWASRKRRLASSGEAEQLLSGHDGLQLLTRPGLPFPCDWARADRRSATRCTQRLHIDFQVPNRAAQRVAVHA